MTKEEKINIQREQITEFLTIFKEKKLDFNNTKLLDKMKEIITKVFQLKIEELGYNCDPDNIENENYVILKIINDSEERCLWEMGYFKEISNGEIIQKKPEFIFNT